MGLCQTNNTDIESLIVTRYRDNKVATNTASKCQLFLSKELASG